MTGATLLTPHARGAIAVVLAEGPAATAAVDACFCAASGKGLSDQPLEAIRYGRWGGPLSWYDPETGRFASIDPIVQDPFSPATLNPYGYAGNNPVRNIDPNGEGFFDFLKAFGAFLLAGLASVVCGPECGAVVAVALLGSSVASTVSVAVAGSSQSPVLEAVEVTAVDTESQGRDPRAAEPDPVDASVEVEGDNALEKAADEVRVVNARIDGEGRFQGLLATERPLEEIESELENAVIRNLGYLASAEQDLRQRQTSDSILDRTVGAFFARRSVAYFKRQVRAYKFALQRVRGRLGKDPITGRPIPQ